MNTNFDFTLTELKICEGNSQDSLAKMAVCTAQMEEFARSQANTVEEFAELTRIMSRDGERIISDCLIAINHIYLELEMLSRRFVHTDMSRLLLESVYAVRKIKEDTQGHVDHLQGFLICN